ncbi:UNVERIFIED_CONTAM: protein REVERSION-TO-ETHYLENE SENSITIVITY1 [Sesamum angustifolium]|uniref:Protein REVERSION-TO-ETHYLENE SENSITIVITY1 n=1 Tax=Sesamum angustifolium TaxID=2727405 RepID=A0AAW2MGK6_9LAMI
MFLSVRLIHIAGILSLTELTLVNEAENRSYDGIIQHEQWPLNEVDPQKAKFPCCVVWTPLPVVSWLAPFIGHVGVCREDGTIIDFSGSNLIQVDDFAFGPVGRYLQLDRKQGCFPPTLAGHTCKHHSMHAEYGTAITWDDAIQSSSRHYEHKSYNLFTCNCHLFVANCLNRMCYGGSMNWNVVNVAALILCKGKWVDGFSVLRSFMPFVVVVCFGIFMVGWPFLVGLFSFSFLLIGWFLLGAYCFRNVVDC